MKKDVIEVPKDKVFIAFDTYTKRWRTVVGLKWKDRKIYKAICIPQTDENMTDNIAVLGEYLELYEEDYEYNKEENKLLKLAREELLELRGFLTTSGGKFEPDYDKLEKYWNSPKPQWEKDYQDLTTLLKK